MKKYWVTLILIALFIIVGLSVLISGRSTGPDWPMWGYDEGRTFSMDMNLPEQLELLWVRNLPEPGRAWPVQNEDYFTSGNQSGIGKLSFDVSYEPVIGNGRMYVSSMVSDKVSAYATDTGKELWRFYTDGPVRFAPVYDDEKVYLTSDDGNLYCLHARTGKLLWRYQGSYTQRSVLGNERIISIWPARGGPVISEGIVYFASGILAFEGVFVHAVNADTGETIWNNSTSGTLWDLHQHGGAWSYGGPSPQGYLALSGDKLIVPGGRTPPAVYDRKTGAFLYYRQASGEVGKGAGGYRVHAKGNWFFNHGMLYSLKDGAQFGPVPGTVLTEDRFIGAHGSGIFAHSSSLQSRQVKIEDRLQRQAIREEYELESLWVQDNIDGLRQVHFQAGSHLSFSRDGGRAGLFRLDESGRPEEIVWEYDFGDEIWSMIPADEKMFVVTESGSIYCFGERRRSSQVTYWNERTPRLDGKATRLDDRATRLDGKATRLDDRATRLDDRATRLDGKATRLDDRATRLDEKTVRNESAHQIRFVRSVVTETTITDGYGFVFGVDTEMIKTLTHQTNLHILAIYENDRKAEKARRDLDDAGLYGRRTAVLSGRIEELRLPPYLAELVIMQGDDFSAGQVTLAFDLLRPYGGKLFVVDAGKELAGLISGLKLENGKLEQVTLENNGRMITLTREGALPGSGKWTHQYGDVSNRTWSAEERVKPPLGTVWFGGPSNEKILPRHSSGPIPQVVGGRLFILGVESISARCVYTGRELWTKDLPGIGHPFTNLELEERFAAGNEVYMTNQPGANVKGSPYVSLEDGVYVIYQNKLLHLDPASGEIINKFFVPSLGELEREEWGHIMVWEDLIIATVDPHVFADGGPGDDETWWNASSSSWLLVMDRHNGNVLWSNKANREGYRHNAITAGNGRLYAIEGLSDGALDLLQRRGLQPERGMVLTAFDIRTGRKLWNDTQTIFGTWLGYYEDRDLLLEGGRHGGKRNLPDEPRTFLVARKGETGDLAWQYQGRYSGSLGLHNDMIIPGKPGEQMINPETGKVYTMEHPLTGQLQELSYHRYYGCGTMNSSKNMIMFRSGAAGFTDLVNFGGTGNLGGFRSGCTNNLVAADGLLNAPDYTRTCTCSYQLQTSLGFVHMPDVEMWTFNRLETGGEPIRSLGINFGAPGNRRENGVLWLEYPKMYGAGPDAPVTVESSALEWFRNHATWVENNEDGHPWVASYGAIGMDRINIELIPENSGKPDVYDVTLYFAEPDNLAPGERVFDVLVQGNRVHQKLDIIKEAGGSRRVYRMELNRVPVANNLEIAFTPQNGSLPAVISGVEIQLSEVSAMSNRQSGLSSNLYQ